MLIICEGYMDCVGYYPYGCMPWYMLILLMIGIFIGAYYVTHLIADKWREEAWWKYG